MVTDHLRIERIDYVGIIAADDRRNREDELEHFWKKFGIILLYKVTFMGLFHVILISRKVLGKNYDKNFSALNHNKC